MSFSHEDRPVPTQVFCVDELKVELYSSRVLMGKAAAELADKVIITDDNPRHEVPENIRREILDGIPKEMRQHTRMVGDRKNAIEEAICLASREDIVMILGKGHEKTQSIGDLSVPFDDVLIARSALEAWSNG